MGAVFGSRIVHDVRRIDLSAWADFFMLPKSGPPYTSARREASAAAIRGGDTELVSPVVGRSADCSVAAGPRS